MMVEGAFIACISPLVFQIKMIHFDEEQFASRSHVRRSASRRTSDPEELIVKKGNLLFPDYRSLLPIENFTVHRQKWQIPLTHTLAPMEPQLDTPRVMNEPITSILKIAAPSENKF